MYCDPSNRSSATEQHGWTPIMLLIKEPLESIWILEWQCYRWPSVTNHRSLTFRAWSPELRNYIGGPIHCREYELRLTHLRKLANEGLAPLPCLSEVEAPRSFEPVQCYGTTYLKFKYVTYQGATWVNMNTWVTLLTLARQAKPSLVNFRRWGWSELQNYIGGPIHCREYELRSIHLRKLVSDGLSCWAIDNDVTQAFISAQVFLR